MNMCWALSVYLQIYMGMYDDFYTQVKTVIDK